MLPIKIMIQPDDFTCGPTSLHAVYNFYKDNISLEQVIKEVSYLETGGTLAVFLGIHALGRGYDATVYSYNLRIFDPSWNCFSREELIKKLKQQLEYKKGKKLHYAINAYLSFLEKGGNIKFDNLTSYLLKKYFIKNEPVLVGLSATYLYQCTREYENSKGQMIYDDVKGFPSGHFVVLCGYDDQGKKIVVADPYKENPLSENNHYPVEIARLINSILLGIVTYDANLLIINPKGKKS